MNPGDLFQGGYFYEPDAGNPYLICSIGGRILRVEPDTGVTTDLSTAFGLVNPNTDKAFFCQGEKFLLIQAGDYGLVATPTLPLIWDGTTLRRSLGITTNPIAPGTPGVNEIPAGTCMVYYQGRLWYAQGRTLSAGDIVGGPSGTLANGFRDSILNVTEAPLIVGGDGFNVPSESGNIQAVAYTANVDTNLGQGPLYIGTRRQMYALQVPTTRSDWIATNVANAPQMTVVQFKGGPANDRSIVHSNGDLYYQTVEPAIRSLIIALRYYNTFGNTPISANVTRAVANNDRSLLLWASGIQFDNRIYETCLPFSTPVGVAHKGIVVLDFDTLANFQDKLKQNALPAWDGMIEPGPVLQMWTADFNGVERAFAALWFEDTASIELWEITNWSKTDEGDRRIPWLIETPAYNCGAPFQQKILDTVKFWFDEIFGTVDVEVYFREDSNPCWHPWTAFRLCTARDDGASPYPTILCPGGQIPVTLPTAPASDCNVMQKRPCNLGYQFQLRLQIKGWMRVRGIVPFMQPKEEAIYYGLSCAAPSALPPLTP